MSTATTATVAAIAEDTTMVEPDVYLEKLSAFSRMLRLEGLPVSPKETEDACRILIRVGFDDRDRVKTALRTVFAKSREEQRIFDRLLEICVPVCFDCPSLRKEKAAENLRFFRQLCEGEGVAK